MKNSGKNLRFWFDGTERPVDSVEFDADFNEIETTDSSTPSPATDFIMGRAKRTTKISANLYEAHGAEIASGDLIPGKKYIVTAKDTVLAAYDIGEIFTAPSALTMSATDKVQPLGEVLNGKNISCSIAASPVPVTMLKFSEAYGEFDATDSSTTGDATEFISGRAKRTSSIELIQTQEDADALESDPEPQAVVLTFGSGLTISGNATFRKKTTVSNSLGDMVKTSYELSWNGAVANTLFGLLTPAVDKDATIIWAKGTTNKEVDGTLMILSTEIDADAQGLVKATYSGNWVGEVDEDVVT